MKILNLITKPLEFIRKHLIALAFLLIVFLIFAPKDEVADNANLARLNLYGAILNSDGFLAELNKLESNKNLKGILLVIDSPGGALAPSVEISEAIKRVNARIPIVAYAQGSMASGSYLAGVFADSIVANRGALLGSIGVILNGADISELAQKLGIKPQTLKAGIYKEAGTFMRAWSKEEEEMLRGLIEEQYNMFVSTIKEARQIKAPTSEFAEGRILSADSALKLGLIDKIGGIYEAQEILAKKAGVKEMRWLKDDKDKLEVYLEKLFANQVAKGVQNGVYNALVESFKISF
ncbi:MAG: signal peptide peptidase SppA [Helicobacter sp.]|nr:signal peptide peptidase SppA [Helicobacter sp.]